MNNALKAAIDAAITTNGTGAITGAALNTLLTKLVKEVLITCTYAEMAAFIAADAGVGTLIPGATYKINDRGDKGIFLTALTPNSLSKEGIRLMQCPKNTIYDNESSDANIIGTWRKYKGKYSFNSLAGGTFTVGNIINNGSGTLGYILSVGADFLKFWKITGSGFSNGDTFTEEDILGAPTGVTAVSSSLPCIAEGTVTTWAGHVFKNKTGSIGFKESDQALNATDWELVSKSNTDYYDVLPFGCNYDFQNDVIESQWDNYNVRVTLPVAFQIGFGFNPIDTCDWNQRNTSYIVSNILTFFGFRNWCPCPLNRPNVVQVNNVRAGTIQENDCWEIVNITANGTIYPSTVADYAVFGAISGNKCKAISDINRSGGISNIPDNVSFFIAHTDDESCGFSIDFSETPLIVGQPQYLNCILESGVILTEIASKGIGLNDNSNQIAIGIEVDSELYQPSSTAVSTLNGNGYKKNTVSSPTTAAYRRIRFEAFGNDVNDGVLKVAFKYL